MKFLCLVFSIRPANTMIIPGIRRNTDKRLKIIALIRTIPISLPIPNCMNSMAIRPPIVVSELPDISGIDLERAMIHASLGGSSACSSLYLLRKITA